MVRKLYKHEFRAWLRVMPIIYTVMLTVAVMHRLLQVFEADSVFYYIPLVSAFIAYFIVLYAGIFSPVVFGVVRFYRNMFTSEGYLTMTLPVTAAQHLWVKVSTAVCFYTLTLLVGVITGLILTAGDMFTELCKAAAYLMEDIPGDVMCHLIIMAVEMLIAFLVAAFSSFLLYYACLCIGQLFRKMRILAAIGAYFCYYLIAQAIGTVFSILFSMLAVTGLIEKLAEFMDKLGDASVHLVILAGILISGVLALVYFLVCHYILQKKLNLE